MIQRSSHESALLPVPAPGGAMKVGVHFHEESPRLPQRAVAELFGLGVLANAKPPTDIFESGEMGHEAAVSTMEVLRFEGERRAGSGDDQRVPERRRWQRAARRRTGRQARRSGGRRHLRDVAAMLGCFEPAAPVEMSRVDVGGRQVIVLEAAPARHVDHGRTLPKSRTFKKLQGAPVPSGMDVPHAWSDGATGQLFGHYDAGSALAFDRLAGHLP